MKKSIWAGAMAAAMALTTLASQAAAEIGDSTTFAMVRSPGATCLSNDARARVTVSDLGFVQNMHVELVGLTPHNAFTLFVTQHGSRPFGLSWYQGEILTDKEGRGVGDFTGIFSGETFILGDTPVQTSHLGIWFADPEDAGRAGCSSISTPFDGDHVGGILVLSTSNFRDDRGPLQRLGGD
jgi:hypothetical protein